MYTHAEALIRVTYKTSICVGAAHEREACICHVLVEEERQESDALQRRTIA